MRLAKAFHDNLHQAELLLVKVRNMQRFLQELWRKVENANCKSKKGEQ